MSTKPDETISNHATEEDEAIRFLGRILGKILHTQEGGLAYDTVEEIRRASELQ